MFLAYIGIYTLFLVVIWGFFIVVRIHALKFKNFSNNIERVTALLLVVLSILSVLGYIAIFFSGELNDSVSIDREAPNYSEIDY